MVNHDASDVFLKEVVKGTVFLLLTGAIGPMLRNVPDDYTSVKPRRGKVKGSFGSSSLTHNASLLMISTLHLRNE